MEAIQISDEFIKLGQALKLANLVSSGVEAKIVVQNGEVKVNGEVDTRRGRKLYPQDVFEYDGEPAISELTGVCRDILTAVEGLTSLLRDEFDYAG